MAASVHVNTLQASAFWRHRDGRVRHWKDGKDKEKALKP